MPEDRKNELFEIMKEIEETGFFLQEYSNLVSAAGKETGFSQGFILREIENRLELTKDRLWEWYRAA